MDTRYRLGDKVIEEWKIDAIISHLNRGCEGSACGQLEGRLWLLEKGIPIVTFEGNMADPRDFDVNRAIAQIDAFMESLGLERLSN